MQIRGCYNTGTLTGISFGKVYLGGIAGKLEGGTIDSCYNWGTINATPCGVGHIRTVGGIAGCEEDHTDGTAISNCYNTGTINLDTSLMVSGKYIYLVGAISGGNNSDGNTMGYEDCFYLEGCIPSQDPSHSSYQWWNASYKANTLLYDTESVLARTDDELMNSQEVLDALGSSFQSNGSGYPLLTWQTGGSVPAPQSYAVSAAVSGGSAAVNAAKTAQEGSAVTFTVSDVEEGKQVKHVSVTDASGAAVSISENEGTYSFTMPARAVTITVVLENAVEDSADCYAVNLPAGLDTIWNISVSSTQYDEAEGTAAEGATVTIVVSKNEDALCTSFSGITVTTSDSGAVETAAANVKAKNGVTYYGEYTFTMDAFVADSADPINNGFPVLGWQLGAAEPIAVSTKYEGEFKYEYIENQKFSIGTFKLYAIYNNDSTAELKDYRVFIDDTEIDTSTYKFTQEDNGKTLMVTWTAQGIEVNQVAQTLAITPDALARLYCWYGSAKLGKYFTGETIDVSGITEVGYFMESGTSLHLRGEALQELVFVVKTADGTELPADAPLTMEYDGATLYMNYTYREKTIEYALGTLSVMESREQVNGYYELSTAEDIVWFASAVSAGKKDANGILLNDIDLTGVSPASMSDYTGTFDGNGKTLTVKSALFASISTGTVKNPTVTGTINGSGVGGIVSTINGAAAIMDCVSKVNITTTATYTGTIGGIVGTITSSASGAVITRCVNYGTMTLAYNYGTVAGGIAGKVDCADATISECINMASVSGAKYFNDTVGGIAGSSKGIVTDCYNLGAVSATQHSGDTVGGMVGSNSGTISNCYNLGTISSKVSPLGAIAGSNSGSVVNSYALTGTCASLTGSGSTD